MFKIESVCVSALIMFDVSHTPCLYMQKNCRKLRNTSVIIENQSSKQKGFRCFSMKVAINFEPYRLLDIFYNLTEGSV